MPFRSSFYFITSAYLKAREATVAPRYALYAVPKRAFYTRLIAAFLTALLSILPLIGFVWRQIHGEPWGGAFFLAVLLLSFSVSELIFGFLRGAVLSGFATLLAYLWVLLVEFLTPFRTSGKEWLFYFVLLDVALLLFFLLTRLWRIYKRRHFSLLADMSRREVSLAVNLSPPDLRRCDQMPLALSRLYTVIVTLTGKEDGLHFRQVVAADLAALLRRRGGHLLLCSLLPSADRFSFVFYGDPTLEKTVRRFFSSRATSFTVESVEDPEFARGTAMLPTLPELFRMYSELFFYLADSFSTLDGSSLPVSFFAAFPDKQSAAAFVLEAEKEDFRLVKTRLVGEEEAADHLSFQDMESMEGLPAYQSYVVLEKLLPLTMYSMNAATDFLAEASLLRGGELATWDIFFVRDAASPEEPTGGDE